MGRILSWIWKGALESNTSQIKNKKSNYEKPFAHGIYFLFYTFTFITSSKPFCDLSLLRAHHSKLYNQKLRGYWYIGILF